MSTTKRTVLSGHRSRLSSLLDSRKSLSPVRQFLRNQDWLIIEAFKSAHDCVKCVPDFALAEEFCCDFLVISVDSAAWSVSFVVLGPVNKRLFLSNGDGSKELQSAKSRVFKLREYVQVYPQALRRQLARLLRRDEATRNLLLSLGAAAPDEIEDARSCLNDH